MIQDERLNQVNKNIITKKGVDAFTEKELIQFLQKNNTKEAIVVGLMADYYIKETLLGGKELGYEMYFIPEAILGKSEQKKEKILTKLMGKGIKKLSISEL